MASDAEEKTFLTLQGLGSFFHDPRNKKFKIIPARDLDESSEDEEERATSCPILPPPLLNLRLTTDDEPKNPLLGFLFGRLKMCDVLLDQRAARPISCKQFAIQVQPVSRDLILVNYSSNGTAVSFDNGDSFMILKAEKVIALGGRFVIVLDDYERIYFYCPNHANLTKYWIQYCYRLSSRFPNLDSLSLDAASASSCVLTTSPDYRALKGIRCGGSGLVYCVEYSEELYAMKRYKNDYNPKFWSLTRVGSHWLCWNFVNLFSQEHIVKMHRIIEWGDRPALIMDYYKLGSLES